MQAYSNWTDPVGTLGTIVHEAQARVAALEARRAELEQQAAAAPRVASMSRALRQDAVALLAEVKRRSPSKGAIAEGLDAVTQARAYAAGGAAAISILTEPAHFGGSVDDLVTVCARVAIPILKKDFHVAPIQLLEAKAVGASAALLIARALSPTRLGEMMRVGRALGLELLVEVRDEVELDRALTEGATMVGVNNRNLESLLIDVTTCDRIIPLIPSYAVAIAESGVRDRSDVERYSRVGADAVLVGSVLSSSPNPEASTFALTGVVRRERAG